MQISKINDLIEESDNQIYVIDVNKSRNDKTNHKKLYSIFKQITNQLKSCDKQTVVEEFRNNIISLNKYDDEIIRIRLYRIILYILYLDLNEDNIDYSFVQKMFNVFRSNDLYGGSNPNDDMLKALNNKFLERIQKLKSNVDTTKQLLMSIVDLTTNVSDNSLDLLLNFKLAIGYLLQQLKNTNDDINLDMFDERLLELDELIKKAHEIKGNVMSLETIIAGDKLFRKNILSMVDPALMIKTEDAVNKALQDGGSMRVQKGGKTIDIEEQKLYLKIILNNNIISDKELLTFMNRPNVILYLQAILIIYDTVVRMGRRILYLRDKIASIGSDPDFKNFMDLVDFFSDFAGYLQDINYNDEIKYVDISLDFLRFLKTKENIFFIQLHDPDNLIRLKSFALIKFYNPIFQTYIYDIMNIINYYEHIHYHEITRNTETSYFFIEMKNNLLELLDMLPDDFLNTPNDDPDKKIIKDLNNFLKDVTERRKNIYEKIDSHIIKIYDDFLSTFYEKEIRVPMQIMFATFKNLTLANKYLPTRLGEKILTGGGFSDRLSDLEKLDKRPTNSGRSDEPIPSRPSGSSRPSIPSRRSNGIHNTKNEPDDVLKMGMMTMKFIIMKKDAYDDALYHQKGELITLVVNELLKIKDKDIDVDDITDVLNTVDFYDQISKLNDEKINILKEEILKNIDGIINNFESFSEYADTVNIDKHKLSQSLKLYIRDKSNIETFTLFLLKLFSFIDPHYFRHEIKNLIRIYPDNTVLTTIDKLLYKQIISENIYYTICYYGKDSSNQTEFRKNLIEFINVTIDMYKDDTDLSSELKIESIIEIMRVVEKLITQSLNAIKVFVKFRYEGNREGTDLGDYTFDSKQKCISIKTDDSDQAKLYGQFHNIIATSAENIKDKSKYLETSHIYCGTDGCDDIKDKLITGGVKDLIKQDFVCTTFETVGVSGGGKTALLFGKRDSESDGMRKGLVSRILEDVLQNTPIFGTKTEMKVNVLFGEVYGEKISYNLTDKKFMECLILWKLGHFKENVNEEFREGIEEHYYVTSGIDIETTNYSSHYNIIKTIRKYYEAKYGDGIENPFSNANYKSEFYDKCVNLDFSSDDSSSSEYFSNLYGINYVGKVNKEKTAVPDTRSSKTTTYEIFTNDEESDYFLKYKQIIVNSDQIKRKAEECSKIIEDIFDYVNSARTKNNRVRCTKNNNESSRSQLFVIFVVYICGKKRYFVIFDKAGNESVYEIAKKDLEQILLNSVTTSKKSSDKASVLAAKADKAALAAEKMDTLLSTLMTKNIEEFKDEDLSSIDISKLISHVYLRDNFYSKINFKVPKPASGNDCNEDAFLTAYNGLVDVTSFLFNADINETSLKTPIVKPLPYDVITPDIIVDYYKSHEKVIQKLNTDTKVKIVFHTLKKFIFYSNVAIIITFYKNNISFRNQIHKYLLFISQFFNIDAESIDIIRNVKLILEEDDTNVYELLSNFILDNINIVIHKLNLLCSLQIKLLQLKEITDSKIFTDGFISFDNYSGLFNDETKSLFWTGSISKRTNSIKYTNSSHIDHIESSKNVLINKINSIIKSVMDKFNSYYFMNKNFNTFLKEEITGDKEKYMWFYHMVKFNDKINVSEGRTVEVSNVTMIPFFVLMSSNDIKKKFFLDIVTDDEGITGGGDESDGESDGEGSDKGDVESDDENDDIRFVDKNMDISAIEINGNKNIIISSIFDLSQHDVKSVDDVYNLAPSTVSSPSYGDINIARALIDYAYLTGFEILKKSEILESDSKKVGGGKSSGSKARDSKKETKTKLMLDNTSFKDVATIFINEYYNDDKDGDDNYKFETFNTIPWQKIVPHMLRDYLLNGLQGFLINDFNRHSIESNAMMTRKQLYDTLMHIFDNPKYDFSSVGPTVAPLFQLTKLMPYDSDDAEKRKFVHQILLHANDPTGYSKNKDYDGSCQIYKTTPYNVQDRIWLKIIWSIRHLGASCNIFNISDELPTINDSDYEFYDYELNNSESVDMLASRKVSKASSATYSEKGSDAGDDRPDDGSPRPTPRDDAPLPPPAGILRSVDEVMDKVVDEVRPEDRGPLFPDPEDMWESTFVTATIKYEKDKFPHPYPSPYEDKDNNNNITVILDKSGKQVGYVDVLKEMIPYGEEKKYGTRQTVKSIDFDTSDLHKPRKNNKGNIPVFVDDMGNIISYLDTEGRVIRRVRRHSHTGGSGSSWRIRTGSKHRIMKGGVLSKKLNDKLNKLEDFIIRKPYTKRATISYACILLLAATTLKRKVNSVIMTLETAQSIALLTGKPCNSPSSLTGGSYQDFNHLFKKSYHNYVNSLNKSYKQKILK